jgi:toxin-antitoxin system PIN domain toxin
LIIPDVNLLLPWAVALGFVRSTTNPRVFQHPIAVAAACDAVEAWLLQPSVMTVHPGRRHADLLFGYMRQLGVAANLTTDAHLAALAVEHQAELHSTDADFHRFRGLRWLNPLAG